MRRQTLLPRAVCAVVLVFAVSCSGGGGSEGSGSSLNPAAERAERPCVSRIPFDVTYLPAGFSKKLEDGPAPGKSEIKNVTIFHYTGTGGKYMEIFRGGRRHESTPGVPIKVGGRFGRVGHISGGGFAIRLRLSRLRCNLFQWEIYGVPSKEAVKVGHGIAPKGA